MLRFILSLILLAAALLYSSTLRKTKLGRLFLLFLFLMTLMLLLDVVTGLTLFSRLAFVFLCHVAAVAGIVLFFRLSRR